jgi:hypothetical protein
MLAKYIVMTPLDKTLKRALNIKGRDYVISLSPDSLKITEKGHRIGLDLLWAEIVSGETALAVALRASLGKFKDVARRRHEDQRHFQPRCPRQSAYQDSPHDKETRLTTIMTLTKNPRSSIGYSPMPRQFLPRRFASGSASLNSFSCINQSPRDRF